METSKLMSFTMLVVFASIAIGISFICSILEAVLLSTSLSHVALLESEKRKGAALWRIYKDEPERPLTAILTLNTIAHTVGALGVGVEVTKLYEGDPRVEMAMFVATALMTLGILLLSEILPKTLGTLYWKKLSTVTALTLRFLIIILIWIVAPIEWIRSLFPIAQQETVTRQELSALAEVAEDEDAIEEDEEQVIVNLLKLKDMEVKEIMTPRVVITHVNQDSTVEEIMAEIPIMIHGRMPVCGDSIDDTKGLVLRSDILRLAAKDEFSHTMTDIMRKLYSVESTQSIDEALDILLDNQVQLLVVRDEFGGTTGLVSMEDIIETLLGREIVDETDLDAIEEGTTAEDMREFAKQKAEQNGNS